MSHFDELRGRIAAALADYKAAMARVEQAQDAAEREERQREADRRMESLINYMRQQQ